MAYGRFRRKNPPAENSAMERVTGKDFSGGGRLGWNCTALRRSGEKWKLSIG
jgi:hypothetical protein